MNVCMYIPEAKPFTIGSTLHLQIILQQASHLLLIFSQCLLPVR